MADEQPLQAHFRDKPAKEPPARKSSSSQKPLGDYRLQIIKAAKGGTSAKNELSQTTFSWKRKNTIL